MFAPHDDERLLRSIFRTARSLRQPYSNQLRKLHWDIRTFERHYNTVLCGQEKNHLNVGPYKTTLTCYRIGHGPHCKIGTSYPELEAMNATEAAMHIQALARGKRERKALSSSKAAAKNAKRRQAQRREKQQTHMLLMRNIMEIVVVTRRIHQQPSHLVVESGK